jgi:transcriptional regulator of arginine metabolism
MMNHNLEKIIREIISEKIVSTQKELSDILKAYGVNIAQSNLSKKLRDFNIIRRFNENGESYYWAPHKNIQAQDSINEFALCITDNGNIIVVKTQPGTASIIGQIIDERFPKEKILGTVAGYDTLIIVPKNKKDISLLIKELKEKFIRK